MKNNENSIIWLKSNIIKSIFSYYYRGDPPLNSNREYLHNLISHISLFNTDDIKNNFLSNTLLSRFKKVSEEFAKIDSQSEK